MTTDDSVGRGHAPALSAPGVVGVLHAHRRAVNGCLCGLAPIQPWERWPQPRPRSRRQSCDDWPRDRRRGLMKRILSGLVIVMASAGIASAQGGKRPLSLDDLAKIKDVRDPQCAPDGKTVAFVVSQIDVKEDKAGNDTSGPSASTDRTNGRSRRAQTARPRRASARTGNIWPSRRRGRARPRAIRSGCSIGSGGEAFQLTEIKGRLQGYEWSPDSKRLALTIGDPDPDATDTPGESAAPAGAGAAQGARSRSSSIATSTSRTCRAICCPVDTPTCISSTSRRRRSIG